MIGVERNIPQIPARGIKGYTRYMARLSLTLTYSGVPKFKTGGIDMH